MTIHFGTFLSFFRYVSRLHYVLYFNRESAIATFHNRYISMLSNKANQFPTSSIALIWCEKTVYAVYEVVWNTSIHVKSSRSFVSIIVVVNGKSLSGIWRIISRRFIDPVLTT